MVTPEFVEFPTKDGLMLPGLLYPASRGRAVAIYLHGNGSSSVFYNTEKNRTLASALAEKGIATFFFNNRGAHIIKNLRVRRKGKTERKYFGMAHEKIKECVPDIDGAVSFLQKHRYRKFFLMGSSTGANKICVYHHYKPRNRFAAYVLLAGGDDTGIYYRELGKKKFWRLLSKAKRAIQAKREDDISTELLPKLVFSHKGFYDIANPDGDYNVFPFLEALFHKKLSTKKLFRFFSEIKKPSLVMYGECDEFVSGSASHAVAVLQKYQPHLNYRIIKDADHGFHGHEKQVARVIAKWLSR